ncbi:hypothetical protein OS493_038377 [Desmophyllum pertusum]|uniref:Guanylate-binding protein/Atlastin C-terminal domain-containing protein n=1 Tax=Desmophyllum pertusum TaxID=174260 RepID=A0A9W9Y782_9CNID|nr:hypothetical protein OS493_038377 [Desmophyllum pertusum]
MLNSTGIFDEIICRSYQRSSQHSQCANSLETFLQIKCQEAKRTALLAYDKKMEAGIPKLPCDGDKILESHESAISQSMDIFDKETVGLASDNTKQDKEGMMNTGREKLADWKLKNDRLTKERCEKLLEELRRKHLDPVLKKVRGPNGTSVSYPDIDEGCAKIENEYKNHALGAKSVHAQVLLEFHERLKVEQDQYKDILKKLKDYDENLLKQRRENADKDKATERLKERNAYLEKEKKIQEKTVKDLEEKKKQELLEKIREFQTREDILKKKIDDMEKAGMLKRIDDLATELKEARGEKKQWESEIRDLKYQLAKLVEQLKVSQRPWYKKMFGKDE